ncbi:thioredoxin family protein [Rubripirellula sp.]|nr:thioredoxin family protein [Rubripirellula sp.]MDB4338918.1 thioredoxin family protein [Rubripirellula sp.]
MSTSARNTASIVILLLVASHSQAEIGWQTDLRAAHSMAQQQGKPLLLHFYADQCFWCDKLEKGALSSPMVGDAIKENFIPVKVDLNTSPKLAEMFKVSKFPSDVIVTSTGKTISHSVSPQDASRFVEMLDNAMETLIEASPSESQIATENSPSEPDPEPKAPLQKNYATLGQPTKNAMPSKQATEEITPPGYATSEIPVSPSQTINPANTDEESALTDSVTTASPSSEGNHLTLPNDALPSATASSDSSAKPDTEMTLLLHKDPVTHQASSPTLSTKAQDTDSQLANAEGIAMPPDTESTSSNGTAQAPDADNATPPELALDGFCPVSVIDEDQWVEGQPEISAVHLGRLYLFASEEKMKLFLADPNPFTPVLNEIDAVVFFEERRIVPGKREWGMKDPIHQRMFFFSDEASMNHFYQQYERYAQSAIDLMDEAIQETHSGS